MNHLTSSYLSYLVFILKDKIVFLLFFLQLDVWALLCRMMYEQSLTLGSCFQSPVLTEHLVLRGGATSVITDNV